MVRLVISDNEGTTTVVPLVRDEITIGRKEGNTIRLTERNISRQHAQLVRAAGVYKLRDLDSYNGVTINGRRVSGESDINTGDQIQIGDYTILVEEEAVARPEPVDEPTTIAARPVSPARLVMLSEPSPGAEFGLSNERAVRLGRAEDVDCPVAHRSVSREHAEVRCQSGDYLITDLDSANGVTVNGHPARQTILKAGDIIELGQVVFRYVAPGEDYFFDAAEAARYRKGFSAKKGPNVRVIAAVLGVASMVAVAIVMSGGSEDPSESTSALAPTSTTQAVAAVPSSTVADDGYDRALTACRSALTGARFAEAIAHATMALKVRADSADASECRAQAQLQYEEEQAYVRGRAAFASGDPEAAYQEFSRLAAKSPFRARPEVAAATESLARARLARGRSALASAPNDAARAAQSVLDLEGVPSGLVSEAESLLAEARRGSETQVAARTDDKPATKPLKPFSAATRPAAAKPAAAAAPTQSAMDAASACLSRGDNDCVIRALNGRANTAQELGLLIETYRAIGDTKQAQKHMATYVKRFPTARRADAYKRMLELQSQ